MVEFNLLLYLSQDPSPRMLSLTFRMDLLTSTELLHRHAQVCVCVSFFQVYLVYVSLQAPPLSLCVWVFFLAVYLHHVHAVPEGGGVIWEVRWVMELHFERVLGIKHRTSGTVLLPAKPSCEGLVFEKRFYFSL